MAGRFHRVQPSGDDLVQRADGTDKNDCKITRYAYSIHQILRCRRFRHGGRFRHTFLGKEKLRLNKYVANSLGFISAASTNYVLNRLWTFHSRDPQVAQQIHAVYRHIG